VEKRRRTWFDAAGLSLEGGGHLPVFAAAMHYWRVDPRDWRACLEAVRALGFELVQTSVPWSVHEVRAGR
jgi:beta-galactosidase